jgi:hypothetical protein
MIAALLFLVLVAVLVTIVVRRSDPHGARVASDGHALRRVFQYPLLYGLLVVVAIGLSGLLGRLLERDVLVTGDEAGLARDLAFVVVGGPLLVGVALWSRRRFAENADEAGSLAWASYVTAASLTSLLVAMVALSQVLRWATGLEDYDGRALARFAVWGVVWGVHWWLDARTVPSRHAQVHHLGGSLVGLATAATGLGGVLAGALRLLLGLDEAVVGGGDRPLLQGLVLLAVGAPVWFVYWVRTAAHAERDEVWLAYVLLAGVAGGLVTAVVAASTLVYSVLVWLVGEPGPASAAEHFDSAPDSAAAAAVGVLVWWYHQEVLGAGAPAAHRTEVRRVYEYLMAAIGLLASAAGLMMVIAALVEALAGRAYIGGDAVNTLLAALTLLAVGGPVWWLYWRRIQSQVHRAPAEELTSPTRHAYLFVLFGVGGLAAVVALITGVYFLFEGIVEGSFGAETFRRMRFPVGVLLTAGAVAAYHWSVYRTDREHAPAPAEVHGPRFVLLVGPPDREIAHAVAHRTHGRVQAWSRADDGLPAWSVDDVMSALEGATAEEVMVLSGADGLQVIPVRRG